MKTLCLLLLLNSSAWAQDIRLIDKRIVDVTAAMSAGPHSAYSNYWVTGKVMLNYPKTLFIEKNEGLRWFVRILDLFGGEAGHFTQEQWFAYNQAVKISFANPKGLKRIPSQFLFYHNFWEQREVIQWIAICNHQSTQTNGTVSILALPIPAKTFTVSTKNRTENITPLCFDAGTPYVPGTNAGKYLSTLTPTGLRDVQFKTSKTNFVAPVKPKPTATN